MNEPMNTPGPIGWSIPSGDQSNGFDGASDRPRNMYFASSNETYDIGKIPNRREVLIDGYLARIDALSSEIRRLEGTLMVVRICWLLTMTMLLVFGVVVLLAQ